jgi:hypothetical protein
LHAAVRNLRMRTKNAHRDAAVTWERYDDFAVS